ncbi:hypothetical protein MYX76_03670 [Desulfobacterota bacterium AH_259_B03_O07]|nr:hypothetical protein [Desulfobacterota bacterium AH_259_B03_O07]
MTHDLKTISTHIQLLFPRKFKNSEFIETACFANGTRKVDNAIWINSKQDLEKLEKFSNLNLSIGNSLRIGDTKKEGASARASSSDCGGKLVHVFDIENEEEHKKSREQGQSIQKEVVKGHIEDFLTRINPIYNCRPLYLAYTGGGGQVGIRLSREIPPHEQKHFGEALKLVFRSYGALIEKDHKTGEIINPIGADPSRFDVAGLQRLIGSYNHERKVQTSFLEINRNSKSLDVDKIFEKAKEIQAQNDKKTVKKIIASNPNYEKWNEFIDKDLIPKITFSQLLLDQGWIGQDKGQYWLFNCNLHPPDNHPSFTVWNDIAGAKDYHTGRGYNPISLIMEIKNLNFKEALRYLADYVGIDCPDFDPPIANKRNSRKKKDKDHSCVWGGAFSGHPTKLSKFWWRSLYKK